jgi:hypothetical protein
MKELNTKLSSEPNMKTNRAITLIVLTLSILNLPLLTLFAQGTAFTYQGRLNDGANPANGSYDLTFSLFDVVTNGNPIAGPLTNAATPVSNGLFTVTLDFGNQFPGAARWLEIGVSTNGGGSFAPLNPRQQLTSAPYSIQAAYAASVAAANITGALTTTQLPSAVVTNGATGVNITGTFIGSGAGLANVPGTMPWQTVAGTSLTAAANQAYLLTNNAATTVTLPTTANVGDIVTVSGAGSNSWQAVTGSGQSIMGYPAAAAGQVWTDNNNAPVTNWQSVASSADGTKLVAITASGSVYTSTDSGATWSGTTLGGQGYAVASSADGSKLVAATSAGIVVNSGGYWTMSLPNVIATSVASSADGTMIAVASANTILTSLDSRPPVLVLTSAADWTSVALSADGTNLVAADVFGIYKATYSPGGGWSTAVSTAPPARWSSLAWSANGTKVVAVNQGSAPYQMYTSGDSGATWTPITSAPGGLWTSVALSDDGTKLVAVNKGGSPYMIWTSTDSGLTWSGNNNAPPGAWQSVASSADGSKLVAVVNGGSIWTSQVRQFSGLAGATAQFQYLGNGVWQPVGQAASQLVGTLSPSQLPASVVTNSEGGVSLSGTFGGDGSALTNLDASQLASGTVPDTQLSTNVALRNGGNTFYGDQYIGGGQYGSLFLDNTAEIWARNTNNTYEGFLWPRWSDNITYLNYGAGGFNIRTNGGTVGNPTMFMTGDGNIGIGTANPAANLDVNGVANISGGLTVGGSGLSGNGAGLTNLNPANLTSGTSSAQLTFNNNQNSFTGNFTGGFGGNFIGSGTLSGSFAGDGSGLTSLNPGNLANGTASARLTFNNSQNSFSGNGGGLTALNAAALTSGQNTWFNLVPGGNVILNGNVGIGNGNPTNRLMVVNARCDGTTWINASDRNLKQDFEPVDPLELLAKVASMPIQSWSYKSHPQEKHVGPVAQDFHAAFGLGSDDKSIATVDEGGVALAAIQGLNQKLEAENAELKARLDKLEQLLNSRLNGGEK